MGKWILPNVGKWTQGPVFRLPAVFPCRIASRPSPSTPTPDAATILPVGCHVQMSVKIGALPLDAKRLTAQHNRAYLVGH